MPDQLSQTLYNLGFGKMVKARDTANRMPQCSSFFKIFKRLTPEYFMILDLFTIHGETRVLRKPT